MRLIDDLVEFARGRGDVLDFSDPCFSQFFAAERHVGIDDPISAEHGRSKGKRLRCFLQEVDDATAARALQALWEHRTELLARNGREDPPPMPKADI